MIRAERGAVPVISILPMKCVGMWMIRLFVCLSLVLLPGCTALGAFDAVVAKDPGAVQVAKDQRFAAGPRGRLDLYGPEGGGGPPRPIIIFFYGGAWNSGSKDDYSFAGRALAAQGFLVAIPDYRLVPHVRFPAFLEDGAAAVRWVRANAARFGGDPDRIVLAGHSAGAYNAAMLALDPAWLGEDREAIRGFAGLAGPYDFLPLDTRVTKETFGKAPDLVRTQPVHFASGDDPPALLLAAGKDDLVFASNSVAMAMALAEAGAEVETRVYPDIGHVGIMAAVSTLFRGKAPVLADLVDFAHRVTDAPKSVSGRLASERRTAMEGRNGQIIDEDVMETASVAPPEPREEEKGFNDHQESGRDSDRSEEDRSQPEPIIRPSPD